MRAIILNCTLADTSPGTSDTEALAAVVADQLQVHGVEIIQFRIIDLSIPSAVAAGADGDDEWLRVHLTPCDADLLVVATPTGSKRSPATDTLVDRLLTQVALLRAQSEASVTASHALNSVVAQTRRQRQAAMRAHHLSSEIGGTTLDIGYVAASGLAARTQPRISAA